MPTTSTFSIEMTPGGTKFKPRLGLGGTSKVGGTSHGKTLYHSYLIEQQAREVFKQKYLVYTYVSAIQGVFLS